MAGPAFLIGGRVISRFVIQVTSAARSGCRTVIKPRAFPGTGVMATVAVFGGREMISGHILDMAGPATGRDVVVVKTGRLPGNSAVTVFAIGCGLHVALG